MEVNFRHWPNEKEGVRERSSFKKIQRRFSSGSSFAAESEEENGLIIILEFWMKIMNSFIKKPKVIFPKPIFFWRIRHFYLPVQHLFPDSFFHFFSLSPYLQLYIVDLCQRTILRGCCVFRFFPFPS